VSASNCIAAASVGTGAMQNIDALIADGGEITIGSVGSLECKPRQGQV